MYLHNHFKQLNALYWLQVKIEKNTYYSLTLLPAYS